MTTAKALPRNTPQLADVIYACVDLSEREEGETLLSVIKSEIGGQVATVKSVENWLRGLPSTCTIPYYDGEIQCMLHSSGNPEWSVDDYWSWAASRVLAFAKHPKAYA